MNAIMCVNRVEDRLNDHKEYNGNSFFWHRKENQCSIVIDMKIDDADGYLYFTYTSYSFLYNNCSPLLGWVTDYNGSINFLCELTQKMSMHNIVT